MDAPKIPGGQTSELKSTMGTAAIAIVALLQSPVVEVQIAALWCLAIVIASYNLARGIAKLGQ